MKRVKEERPKSFAEFVGIIESLQEKTDVPLWFRGCGRDDYKLLPTLYRHPIKTQICDIATLEQKLLTRFRQRSIPFHNRDLTDDWDTLFFMQHYGIPTRLLDWSESPFVSLYFAVMSAVFERTTTGRLLYQSPAAMWVLNPVLWNRHSLNHQSYDGGVLAPGDDALKGYRSVAPSFEGMCNHPAALYGTHNSPRIVAQRGVFTIFGQKTIPMEEACMSEDFPDGSLVKIILSKSALPKIRKSILSHSVTESVVFPDLDGLSKEIRRSFGF